MSKYVIHLKTPEGKVISSKELGSWRDNAVEHYAHIRHKLSLINTAGTLELVDTFNDETILTYTQTIKGK